MVDLADLHDFHLCSLDFALDDLEKLSSAQLAVIQYHPNVTPDLVARAELLFWRRRNRDGARRVSAAPEKEEVKPARPSLPRREPEPRGRSRSRTPPRPPFYRPRSRSPVRYRRSPSPVNRSTQPAEQQPELSKPKDTLPRDTTADDAHGSTPPPRSLPFTPSWDLPPDFTRHKPGLNIVFPQHISRHQLLEWLHTAAIPPIIAAHIILPPKRTGKSYAHIFFHDADAANAALDILKHFKFQDHLLNLFRHIPGDFGFNWGAVLPEMRDTIGRQIQQQFNIPYPAPQPAQPPQPAQVELPTLAVKAEETLVIKQEDITTAPLTQDIPKEVPVNDENVKAEPLTPTVPVAHSAPSPPNPPLPLKDETSDDGKPDIDIGEGSEDSSDDEDESQAIKAHIVRPVPSKHDDPEFASQQDHIPLGPADPSPPTGPRAHRQPRLMSKKSAAESSKSVQRSKMAPKKKASSLLERIQDPGLPPKPVANPVLLDRIQGGKREREDGGSLGARIGKKARA